MMPLRIQRKRAKGWRMPAGAVYVGRPSRWGNLWQVGLRSCGCRSVGECHHNMFRCENAAEAVEQFRKWIEAWKRKSIDELRSELKGKDLACWCPLNQPCHADVLLQVANEVDA